jgi:outer membrane protein assembly factor BamB
MRNTSAGPVVVTVAERSFPRRIADSPINWPGPVLAGNRLIVASTEGDLVSVSLEEGSSTTLFDLKQGVSLPPIVADGMLYILDNSGRISAFR